jgi:hypothetical protein
MLLWSSCISGSELDELEHQDKAEAAKLDKVKVIVENPRTLMLCLTARVVGHGGCGLSLLLSVI